MVERQATDEFVLTISDPITGAVSVTFWPSYEAAHSRAHQVCGTFNRDCYISELRTAIYAERKK